MAEDVVRPSKCIFRLRRYPSDKSQEGMGVTDRFEEFYAEHRDGVLRAVFVSSGELHAAEDAVSEAFTKAFLHWKRLEDHPSKVAWVTRTALNSLRSSWRRRRRMTVSELPEGISPPAEPMDARLFEAVLRLPVRQRQVVGLRVFLDLSTTNTASVLDIAPGTVTAHLSRALSSLRAEMYEEAMSDGS
jgi:RNA polymerase sigma factor (sigma-70 family)